MAKKTLRSRDKSKFLALKNKEHTHSKTKLLTPEMKRIENHPFYRNLLEYAIIPLWEKEKQAKKEKREFEPDDEMLYQIHVAQYAISLFEALKRLHDIPYFMEANPNLTWMENKNIAPQEWFIYHYSNYRVVATGVLDTVLLVVNDVLQINCKPEDIHRISFLGRQELSEHNILTPLKKIDKLLKKYREERNKYVHRSERPEIDFVENLNIYRFLKEAKEKGQYKGQLPKHTLAHAYFNEQKALKAAELRKETVEIFDAVQEFLDILNELYLVNCQDFLNLPT
jgi:hypothetical protein